PGAGLAQDDGLAGEPVQIEGVERLADLPEDVVGRVHGRADRLGADRGEPGADALRRRSAGDAGDHAAAEAPAEARDLDSDGGERRGGGRAPPPGPSPAGRERTDGAPG